MEAVMYVSVYVDPEEVLDEIDTDELAKELSKRAGFKATKDEDRELLECALRCLRGGDYAEAEIILSRFLEPKFKSVGEAMKQYSLARSVQ
jgi:hypothetical protein